jgi:hypothetical protein
MRLREKQYGFSNKPIIRRGSLSKPSVLEQLPKEIRAFYFFVSDRALIANVVSNIAF